MARWAHVVNFAPIAVAQANDSWPNEFCRRADRVGLDFVRLIAPADTAVVDVGVSEFVSSQCLGETRTG